ncbi:MAG: HAD family hydrolase [Candidatus Heimdallarchaeota archaeon]|nr:HAD family hydrolase [Candidatus Heimdallarchaeota archaeon]
MSAITFDMIGVLTSIPQPEVLLFEKERREYRIFELLVEKYDITRPQFDKAVESTFSTIEFERENRCFDYGIARITHLLLTNLSLVPEYATRIMIEQLFNDSIFNLQLAPREGSYAVLEHLKREGFKLGLIVNTLFSSGDAFREFVIINLGFQSIFDSMVFSNEIGFLKPHSLIFDASMRELSIDNPQEILHIGDNPKTDIIGAKEANLKTGFFQNRRHRLPDSLKPNLEICDLIELPDLISHFDW